MNIENAMDLPSGIYLRHHDQELISFSFTGLTNLPDSSESNPNNYAEFEVKLILNGQSIGTGYLEEGNTINNQNDQVTIHSTLNLKSGDRVWVVIAAMATGAFLFDSDYHCTHFSGFLLEEDIVASL
jgi:hypothetical protein